MLDRIVPRRGRPVVAMPRPTHVRISLEPGRVVVASVDTHRSSVGWLAVRRHAVAVSALADLAHGGRDVHQQPMRKVDSGEVGGHFAVGPIDIIWSAWAVGVDARDDERAGSCRRITPCEMWIAIAAERHRAGLVGHSEGMARRFPGSIGERVAAQLHACTPFVGSRCDNSPVDIRLVVLGAGQDGGSPQLGWVRGSGPPRTASSVALVADQLVILLDASPDIRYQFATLSDVVGARPPDRPFDAICITHGHMGHYGGLIHLGTEAAATDHLPIVAPSSVLAFLRDNEPWRSLFTEGHAVGIDVGTGPVSFGPIAIHAIPVPHRADHTETVAFSIVIEDHPWALYLPDIDSWDAWPEAEATLEAHDICLVDASFGTDGEVVGRDIASIPHPLVSDTIERFAHLTSGRRIVLTHMNHTNALADPDSELATRARKAGFTVAHDGLILERERVT